MNWVAAGVIVSGLVSVIASAVGYVNSRRADKSASTTRTIELGVKDLIDQYQEANRGLHDDLVDCQGKCAAVQEENRELRSELEDLQRRYDNLEADVIRLKRKAGELQ